MQPIFIHSLFRSGSTYLFSVFRKETSLYYCYQEPDHEDIDKININPDDLIQINNESLNTLRHPSLDRPYFYELHALRERLKGLFDVSISFEGFFPKTSNLPAKQKKYFSSLISNAPAQPVLQLCRSFGRIAQLKNTFKGVHIHLWREPRTQWWSYLVNPYFENTFEKILAAKDCPLIFDQLTKKQQDTAVYSFEYKYYRFFFFWVYAFIQNLKFSDIELSIDLLSSDEQYKKKITHQLEQYQITNINLDDCHSPYTQLTLQEIAAYDKIELEVLAFFESHHTDFKKFTAHIRAQLLVIREKLNDSVTASSESQKYRSAAIGFIAESFEIDQRAVQLKNALEAKIIQLESIHQTALAQNNQEILQKNHQIHMLEAQILQLNTDLASVQVKLEQNSIDFDMQLSAAAAQQKQLETTFNNTLKTKNEALENANEQVRALNHLVELNETNLADAGKQIEALTQKLSVAEQQITTIHNSTSWKLSKPIRVIGHLAKSPVRSTKNIVYRLPNSHQWLKNATKKTLKKAGKAALKYPWLKNKALGFLYSRPALKAKLRFLILTQETTLFTQTVQAEAMTEITAEKDLSTAVVKVKKHNLDAVNAQNKTPLEAYFY